MRFVPLAGEPDFGRPAFAFPDGAEHLDKGRPVFAGPWRRGDFLECCQRFRIGCDRIEDLCRRLRADTRNELQKPEPRNPVTRVLGKAQSRQHVLHMGAIEEFQAAELDEGNVAAGQFHFQRTGMVRGAKQHGLLLQQHAGFAVLEDFFHDIARLLGLVLDGDQTRPLLRLPVGPQVFREPLAGKFDDAIGGCQNGGGRAVVAVERDDVGRRVEGRGKIEDVADRGGAERIDRLGVVAHHRQPAAAGLHRHQDRGLQPVRVLVFVDHDVIEPFADILRNQRLAHHLRPVEQKIVVIENVLRLLGVHIGGEQVAQLRFPGKAPREGGLQDLVQRRLGIDGARIDGKAGALGRKPALRLGEAELVANEVHQVGGILTVVDGEFLVEADLFGIDPQQPCADAVKRAGPGERIGHDAGLRPHHFAADALDAAAHFGGRTAGKRHQQQAARIGA